MRGRAAKVSGGAFRRAVKSSIWFSALTCALAGPPVLAQNDDASFVDQRIPAQVSPGERFVVDITFRNVGTTTWTRWNGIKLGSQAPQDNVRWATNRQRMRNRDSIAPGQNKTFAVEVISPAEPGQYQMQWRLLREGVQWFGELSPASTIQVGGGGGGGGGGSGNGDGDGGGGAPPPGGDGSPPSTGRQYLEQVFAGYQGWFSAPGDGSLNQWNHWGFPGELPRKGRVHFELYPDVREYSGRDLYRSGLGNLRSGPQALLFASNREGVVDLHFRWMREYGIDGIALQRFVKEVGVRSSRLWRNDVTRKVRAAAERHGRSFYVMYDISDANPGSWAAQIRHDWNQVLGQKLGVRTSPAYARQEGRPVVGLWGVGFNDRPGTLGETLELIRWFQNQGVYVVGGVPYYWRDAIYDSKGGWQEVYLSLDVIQPWSVGRYASDSDMEHHYETIVLPDVAHAEAHGVAYQRVLFPGQAWSNWNGGARNAIPRRGGDFLWRQAYYAAGAGVGAFVAMFDEYDEATAIAKAAETPSQVPHDQYFLTLDADGLALPSDHYLWLTGQATRMIRGEIPLQFDRPRR